MKKIIAIFSVFIFVFLFGALGAKQTFAAVNWNLDLGLGMSIGNYGYGYNMYPYTNYGYDMYPYGNYGYDMYQYGGYGYGYNYGYLEPAFTTIPTSYYQDAYYVNPNYYMGYNNSYNSYYYGPR